VNPPSHPAEAGGKDASSSRLPLALVWVALAVALTGCGRQQAAPPTASAPTSAAGPAAAQPIHACALLTADDATEVLGAPVTPATVTEQKLAGSRTSRCVYLTKERPLKVVNLLVQELPNHAQAARAFDFAREISPTVAGSPPRDLPGLGERAFWEGGSTNKLHVLKDNLWMTIGASVGPGLDEQGPSHAAAVRILAHF
jgi:hypothetical protein